IVQLLGVSGRSLVFTTADGIQAMTMDGRLAWRQPDAGRLASHGRGIVAGSWVLWPTRSNPLPVRALHIETGTPVRGPDLVEPTQLRNLRAGNLAFAHGSLV